MATAWHGMQWYMTALNKQLSEIASTIEGEADWLEYWAEVLDGRNDVGSTEDWDKVAASLKALAEQIRGFKNDSIH